MLIQTALDTFWATPYPALQTLGDSPLFTGDPVPESIQDETDVFGKEEAEEPQTDVYREVEII
jgi:hypothetical protein